ncbi:hypothetical protein [Vibrio sp. VB16]|uniref:hypothetical protein n=1 Tax=Vibrio sp. VB16 TaxID=2785746 RepID=UPI00189DAEEA|nr:hypothetical protein [Vibrio sp. VB16]UGA53727.1 hypothetical protein IUZ65_010525 [Vibrio sp. VB16]
MINGREDDESKWGIAKVGGDKGSKETLVETKANFRHSRDNGNLRIRYEFRARY